MTAKMFDLNIFERKQNLADILSQVSKKNLNIFQLALGIKILFPSEGKGHHHDDDALGIKYLSNFACSGLDCFLIVSSADDLLDPLAIGQVRVKCRLPIRRIFLSQMNGWHFFSSLAVLYLTFRKYSQLS